MTCVMNIVSDRCYIVIHLSLMIFSKTTIYRLNISSKQTQQFYRRFYPHSYNTIRCNHEYENDQYC